MPLPTRDMKRAYKALNYSRKGLSNYEIATLMSTGENQIRRWLRYVKEAHKSKKKLSTD